MRSSTRPKLSRASSVSGAARISSVRPGSWSVDPSHADRKHIIKCHAIVPENGICPKARETLFRELQLECGHEIAKGRFSFRFAMTASQSRRQCIVALDGPDSPKATLAYLDDLQASPRP